MAFTHPVLEMIFVLTVAILWSMIFYQLFFTFMGYIHHLRSLKELDNLKAVSDADLPQVSILIPAHNEEIVIEKTLSAMRALEYPRTKLEIIVINDRSTDDTAGIVSRIAREDERVLLFNVPEDETTRGKPRALNLGITAASHDIVAVYDADNTPEADSLRYLVIELINNPQIAGAFGTFRTRNKNTNLLTRFINLETLAFQFMIQAGRYLLFKTAILPGTNLVLRKRVIEGSGGWDEDALTEDTELSIRLYVEGYRIKFVPYAVTWEQEPETWGTWLRQRTRWVRGNFYVLRKFFLGSFRLKKTGLILDLLYLFVLYYLFLASILISHLFLVACGSGFIAVRLPGPYFAVWICAFLVFVAEIAIAAAYVGEATLANIGVIVLMYLSYCQGWIVLVFRAIYQEYVQKGKVKWEKTRRFASR